MKKQELTVCELFAGVGGFRLGLEKSNWETIWANQWEPSKKQQDAYNCYVGKFGDNHNCSNEDITQVNKKEIPNHTLLVGGFPCQDYSVAQTGAKGIEGKKGVLWWEIAEIIKVKKSPYVLLENVDRLIKSPASQRGRDFGIMLRTFADQGYYVEWRVVNAADYGGVQKRRRVFIFAAKKTTEYAKTLMKLKKEKDLLVRESGFFAETFPVEKEQHEKRFTSFDITNKHYETLVDVSDRFTHQFWNSGVMINGEVYTEETTSIKEEKRTLESILEKKSIDEKYFFTKEQLKKIKVQKDAKRIERMRPNGEIYYYSEGGMALYDNLKEPARTMLTSEGSINRSTHVIEDKITGRARRLTPIESEKLNGFPENHTDTMTDRMRYFCMGNALVVDMVVKMGRTLKNKM